MSVSKILVCVMAVVLPAVGFAQDAVTPEKVIERLFGVDPSALSQVLSASEGTFLATIAKTMNVIATSVALAMVLYALFSAAVDNARTAQPGGKRLTWWSAARWVLVLMLLAPAPSGYSVFQGVLLYVANLGSTAASTAWEATEERVLDAQSLMSHSDAVVNSTQVATSRIVYDLYRISLCEATADKIYRDEGFSAGVIGVEPRTIQRPIGQGGYREMWEWGGSGGAPGVTTLPKGVCGTMEFDVPAYGPGSTGASADYRVRFEVGRNLTWLIGELRTVAERDVTNGWTSESRQAILNYYAVAYNAKSVNAVIVAVQAAGGTIEQQQIQKYRSETEGSGWLAAGAYLWTYNAAIGRMTALKRAAYEVSVSPPSNDRMPASLETEYAIYATRFEKNLGRWTSRYAGTDAYEGEMDLRLGAWYSPSSWGSAIDRLGEWMTRVCISGIKSLAQDISNGGEAADPLVNLQILGNKLFVAGEVAWGLIIGGRAVGKAAAAGAARSVPFLGGAIESVVNLFVTIAGAIGSYLLIAGGFLALYLPSIPLLLWVGGLISWMLMLIETILVAPIWAAAHAMPEEEGLAGRYARQGYLLFIGVIARPILMVGALLGALLVARAALQMIVPMYSWFIDLAFSRGTMGPFAAGVLLFIFVLLMVYVARQCFSLIHLVPDRVLRFIGTSESLGEGIREQNFQAATIGALSGLQQLATRLEVKVDRQEQKKGSISSP